MATHRFPGEVKRHLAAVRALAYPHGMQDEQTPVPNGNGDLPLTLERLDWRLREVEGERAMVLQQLGLLTPMAQEMARVGRMTDRFCQAVGIDPRVEGNPPDITQKIRALEERDAALAARDAELAAEVAAAKKEGWARLAESLSHVAKVGGLIVGGLGMLTGAAWGLAQAIGAAVKAMGGGGP